MCLSPPPVFSILFAWLRTAAKAATVPVKWTSIWTTSLTLTQKVISQEKLCGSIDSSVPYHHELGSCLMESATILRLKGIRVRHTTRFMIMDELRTVVFLGILSRTEYYCCPPGVYCSIMFTARPSEPEGACGCVSGKRVIKLASWVWTFGEDLVHGR